MPNNATAKTVSARKWWLLTAASVIVVLLLAVLLGIHLSRRDLQVGGHTYHLEVAQTVIAQEKGLGGRASLPADQGMLFSFSSPAVHCFWMKDMRFPLDIIWADSAKKVVYIQSDVSPRSYPQTFCPSKPAQYVIELNAGQAHAAGITTGQTLKF